MEFPAWGKHELRQELISISEKIQVAETRAENNELFARFCIVRDELKRVIEFEKSNASIEDVAILGYD